MNPIIVLNTAKKEFPPTIISIRPDGIYNIEIHDSSNAAQASKANEGCTTCDIYKETIDFATCGLIYAVYCTGISSTGEPAKLDIYSTTVQTYDKVPTPDTPCGANPSYLVENNVKTLIVN